MAATRVFVCLVSPLRWSAVAFVACMVGLAGAWEADVAQAQEAPLGHEYPGSVALEEVLREGSDTLDPDEWQLVMGRDGEPRFVPTDRLERVRREAPVAAKSSSPDDAFWTGFEPEAVYNDSDIQAIAIDEADHLYVGGRFEEIGGVEASNVAVWDGEAWSSLGGGTSGRVEALTVDASGDLYVGGWFGEAGGKQAIRLAKWNGVEWSPLGGGVNDRVNALEVDGAGNLYVGGRFDEADGKPANRVAKWDGEAWSPLGEGVNDIMIALRLDASGNLYVGGSFTEAGSDKANHIARWDGTEWSALGEGVDDFVFALEVDASDDLYAGGYFTEADGIPANRIAKWDGEAWSSLSDGFTNGNGVVDEWVLALEMTDSAQLYAGGLFDGGNIAMWDGEAWSSLGSGTNNHVEALAAAGADQLYVVGPFDEAGGEAAERLAMWEIPQLETTLSVAEGDEVDLSELDFTASFSTLSLSADLTVTYEKLPSLDALEIGGSYLPAIAATWTTALDPVPAEVEARLCFALDELVAETDPEELLVFYRASSDDSWAQLATELEPSPAEAEQICAPELEEKAMGEFVVAAEESAVPVELTGFEATTDGAGEAVRLEWQTASETDNAGFEVERHVGSEGRFERIGFVEGGGTTTEAQSYHFDDEELPYGAERLTYRLRQVDTDGGFEYSAEVEVDLTAPERFALHGNYPNPTRRHTTIRYALPRATEVQLEVYNALGQRVAMLVDEQQKAGRKQVVFDASGLSSGTYFYRLQAGDFTEARQMVVVR